MRGLRKYLKSRLCELPYWPIGNRGRSTRERGNLPLMIHLKTTQLTIVGAWIAFLRLCESIILAWGNKENECDEIKFLCKGRPTCCSVIFIDKLYGRPLKGSTKKRPFLSFSDFTIHSNVRVINDSIRPNFCLLAARAWSDHQHRGVLPKCEPSCLPPPWRGIEGVGLE